MQCSADVLKCAIRQCCVSTISLIDKTLRQLRWESTTRMLSHTTCMLHAARQYCAINVVCCALRVGVLFVPHTDCSNQYSSSHPPSLLCSLYEQIVEKKLHLYWIHVIKPPSTTNNVVSLVLYWNRAISSYWKIWAPPRHKQVLANKLPNSIRKTNIVNICRISLFTSTFRNACLVAHHFIHRCVNVVQPIGGSSLADASRALA